MASEKIAKDLANEQLRQELVQLKRQNTATAWLQDKVSYTLSKPLAVIAVMEALALIKNRLRLSKLPLVPIRTIHTPDRVHERVTSFSYRHVFSRMCE